MAKKCALFDNREIQDGDIYLPITKHVLEKDRNLYSTPSDEHLSVLT